MISSLVLFSPGRKLQDRAEQKHPERHISSSEQLLPQVEFIHTCTDPVHNLFRPTIVIPASGKIKKSV
jgi:hypothetical protein